MTIRFEAPNNATLWSAKDDQIKVISIEADEYRLVLADGVTPPAAFETSADMAMIDKSGVGRVVLRP